MGLKLYDRGSKSPGDFNRLAEASRKRHQDSWQANAVSRQRKLINCCVLSRANLNIQESLKHSAQDANEYYSVRTQSSVSQTTTQAPKQALLPSHPAAPERTNYTSPVKHTNTKRRVIQHLRTVFSAHSAHREPRLKPLNNELSLPLLAFDKYIPNVETTHLVSILEKTVG